MGFHLSNSRRGHQRFPCAIEGVLYKPMLRPRLGSAKILDIGMGGAKITCAAVLTLQEIYEIKLVYKDEKFSFNFRVAWQKSRDSKTKEYSYGVVFSLSKRQEESLKILLDWLRQDGEPKPGFNLKDYWSS